MGYCELEDLTLVGIRAEALAPVPPETRQAAIDAAAEFMDGYFRARYALPGKKPGWEVFEDWGQDVVRCNAILAVWDLMVVRGFNPASGADVVLRMRYEDLVGRPGQRGWLDKVSAQEIQPNVTPKQHELSDYDQPKVRTAERRGW